MWIMSVAPTSLLGGESVYCINQAQLKEAVRLYESDPDSSPRLRHSVESAQAELSRNEQAALAFVLIEQLRNPPDKKPCACQTKKNDKP
jgi:hypothetical protein